MSVHDSETENVGSPTGRRPNPRRRFWWIIAAAAVMVLIVVLVVAGMAASRTDSKDAIPLGSASTSTPEPTPGTSTSPTPPPSAPEPTTVPVASAPAEDPLTEPAPPAAQAPVALTDKAQAVPGVVFSVDKMEAVDGVARGPGEVGGPSIRFAVTVRNDTADVVSLTSTVVNLFFGADQTPATELTASGGVPFAGAVEPGTTQQGVFIFAVPRDQREQVRIAVDYSVGVPIVVFEGVAP